MKMRKIVAILAAALMLLSILPLSAMAADTAIVFNLGADGSASHVDGSSKTTYSETVGDYTLNLTGGTSMYTGARDQKGNGCIKLGTGSKTGGFSFTVPADVTSVIIAVAKYKANATKLNINSTAHTLTKNSNDGAYDEIEVDTSSTKTVSLATVSGGLRAMVNSITYVIAAGNAGCDHNALKCGETCSNCGETKEHKFSNNCTAECENDCGTANPDYADHVYAGTYDADCDVCFAKREVSLPAADSELTIAEAIELGVGMGKDNYTAGKYYITGEVTEVYNTTYGNLYLTDGVSTITVYGTYSDDGALRYDAMPEKPEAGMTITVYGIIGNYNGTAQMKNGWVTEMIGGCAHEYDYECSTTCNICGKGDREVTCVNNNDACQDGLCVYCGNAVAGLGHTYDSDYDADCNFCGEVRDVPEAPAEATITFDADKTQRTEFTTQTQKWENKGLVLINNKAGSTTNVADYSGRFYKTSEIIISFPGMTSLVIDAKGIGGDYQWAATLDAAALTYTKADNVYTITFAEPVDSITLTAANQVRANSITAYGSAGGSDEPECEHVWVDADCDTPKTCSVCGATEGAALGHNYVADIIDATCTKTGTATYECSACGHSYDEEIPVKPHNYVDGICDACGAELPLEATITFDADKTQRTEFSNEIQKWENEGLVLINNKASSTNNIGDYSNPGRFYKSSEIIISFPSMTTLVIDATGIKSEYAWDATLDGYTPTVADGVYTITFAEPVNSITLIAANQVRANSITASAVKVEEPECQHEYFSPCEQYCMICGELTNPEAAHNIVHVEAVAPTCTALGNIEFWYCDVCGMAWLNAECTMNTNIMAVKLPATGEHTYDDEYDATCNVCGDVRDVPEKPPVEIVYGDADGDGAITTADIILLQQYDAGWDVELDKTSADADGDGAITTADIILLQQYDAGWDVELGPAQIFNDGVLGGW